MSKYQSWGEYPRHVDQRVRQIYWTDDVRRALMGDGNYLARGAGRSQGDVCLNNNGTLLDMGYLNRFVAWDRSTGRITVEAGITLAEILKQVLPDGWFLPVTPGTKLITVGGAIANDVHGKNHHRAGTFGCHVRSLGLLRSSGQELTCSSQENKELFQATIGGLGLTGVVTWAQLQLIRVVSPLIDEEVISMKSIDDFFALAEESDQKYDYTVAWLDCQAKGKNLGRGLFMRGNHATQPGDLREWRSWYRAKVQWPMAGPRGMMNKWSVRAFNEIFYRKNLGIKRSQQVHFNKFFYPLDIVDNWNLVYAHRGFLQYQVVIPREKCDRAIREILQKISMSGKASFLSTLKYFGDIKSPGIMSYPRLGLVLGIDFIDATYDTKKLLDSLDDIVLEAGGAINPSKDARMSVAAFEASFPQWKTFAQFIDPKMTSSFWRRVAGVTE